MWADDDGRGSHGGGSQGGAAAATDGRSHCALSFTISLLRRCKHRSIVECEKNGGGRVGVSRGVFG